MRVLLVDDDEYVNRAMLRLLRRRQDVVPIAVVSASVALERLGGAQFDAVVVDHHLGEGASGIVLLRQIEARWPSVHRVLCSGGAMPGDEPDAHEAAHVVLGKPATVDEIFAALRPGEPAIEAAPRLRARVG